MNYPHKLDCSICDFPAINKCDNCCYSVCGNTNCSLKIQKMNINNKIHEYMVCSECVYKISTKLIEVSIHYGDDSDDDFDDEFQNEKEYLLYNIADSK